MNKKEKMLDFEEMARLMATYQRFDPEGCAEVRGVLIQADKDRKRIEELEQTIAKLQAQLELKAG